MNKLIYLILILITGITLKLNAQNNFWNSKDAYLGQVPPADTPKIFAPGMLADTGAWAGDRVAFSPDGTEFYYSHNTSWFSG